MDKEITLRMSMRQALALLAVLLELGLNRHAKGGPLEAAELSLTKAIYDASTANQDAQQATRSQESPLCP